MLPGSDRRTISRRRVCPRRDRRHATVLPWLRPEAPGWRADRHRCSSVFRYVTEISPVKPAPSRRGSGGFLRDREIYPDACRDGGWAIASGGGGRLPISPPPPRGGCPPPVAARRVAHHTPPPPPHTSPTDDHPPLTP